MAVRCDEIRPGRGVRDAAGRRGRGLAGGPGHLYLDGDFVFYGQGQQAGGIDFEIGKRGGYRSRHLGVVALSGELEWDLFVVDGLAGELNLEVGVGGGGRGGRLGQAGADGDHGELGAAGDLHHVNVAIAVAGVEGFDGDGDEEVALAVVTEALAAGSVADAVGLMEGVGDVIGESALLEEPLAVLGEGGQREEQKRE